MSASPSATPVLRLASASPRRRELLAQIGVPHDVTPADIDEACRPDEPPREYVARVAREKALRVHSRGQAPALLPVLSADTVVVLDGTVFGKPLDRAQGLEMLAALCGRAHRVLTAVALVTRQGLTDALSESTVRLRETTEDERRAYWDTGEPRDKAGAYAIQGLGAVFVESLEGSFSGVMGLPLFETARLLAAAGVPCWLGRGEAVSAGGRGAP
ncbi:MAG: Maf family protein [Steroidobacteraceae bacterium]